MLIFKPIFSAAKIVRMAQIIHPKDDLPTERISDHIHGQGDIPRIQAHAQINYDSFITVFDLPAPPSSAISNGTIVNFDIDPHCFNMVEDIALVLNVTASSSIVMAPGPWWFRTIKLRGNKGAGEYFKWWYPEECMLWMSLMEPEVRHFYERNGMIAFKELKEEMICHNAEPLNSGETRDIYIPLSPSFLNMRALHGGHLAQTLRWELEFRGASSAISGTLANLTVNSIRIRVRQHELPEDEQKQWEMDLRSNTKFFQYLDTMVLTDNTRTLTAQQITRFPLDAVVAKVPFFYVCIKPSLNPVSSDYSLFRPVPWGESATFELETPSQEPLIGKGVQVDMIALRREHIRLTGKKPVRGYYIIPFTDDLNASLHGVINGYRSFIGAKDNLAITFGSTGTQEVITWTTGSAATAGTWHLYWNGEYLAQTAFNATAGTATTALNNSDLFTKSGYVVAVTGNMNSATTIVLTFDRRNGNVSLDNQNHPPVAIGQKLNDAEALPSITTRGVTGFTTSATYQTEIYVPYFRRLAIDHRGVWHTETL